MPHTHICFENYKDTDHMAKVTTLDTSLNLSQLQARKMVLKVSH